MGTYEYDYNWWQQKDRKDREDLLSLVLDDEGRIRVRDVVEALHRHPGCRLAIIEPEFGLVVERIGDSLQ